MKIQIKERDTSISLYGVKDLNEEIVHEITLYKDKSEWLINWSALGSVTINKANDFRQVLDKAIEMCGKLNNNC